VAIPRMPVSARSTSTGVDFAWVVIMRRQRFWATLSRLMFVGYSHGCQLLPAKLRTLSMCERYTFFEIVLSPAPVILLYHWKIGMDDIYILQPRSNKLSSMLRLQVDINEYLLFIIQWQVVIQPLPFLEKWNQAL
jgi:hypothetical protein